MEVLDAIRADVKRLMDNDPAHDFEHVMRVYRNAQRICEKEGADQRLVLSAVLFHDIVSYPKSDRRSRLSPVHSAKKAVPILRKYGFSKSEIAIIHDAVRDHGFSKGGTPATLEGRILQDADRLDAIGAIGIARVFATGGSLGRPFYDPDDPFCQNRGPDDKKWTVDHFYQKLLKLEGLMNTESAKSEAGRRTAILMDYLDLLGMEL